MDSQEKAPIEEQNVEQSVEQNVVETERKQYQTKKEVLERVQEIAHSDEAPQKDEVDYLKTVFYKMHLAEREAEFKEYTDGGGDPEQYQPKPSPEEEAFKAEMGIIKEKRQKLFKEQEQEKQENLQKKLDIIEKIKAMVTSPEEANKSYKDFKALQDEWKEIKNVPAERANELWRNYQLYVEQFYDLLKLNSEAREYDFKKNLELKKKLCEAAEKLADEPDAISAFHQLQKLHQEYRETGPVARELREEIWQRFKAASTVINKRHQQHFEDLRAKEEENLTRKTALCEQAEAICAEENKGSGDWERHTKQIIELQTEWKTIGFAPQKHNTAVFERFREACNRFFNTKSEYFKNLRETMESNLEKKKALLERAVALKDSTEWSKTADELTEIQRQWKLIGAVPKKYSQQIWEEFTQACDSFFQARKSAGADTRSEQLQNLQAKRDIIAQLQALAEDGKEVVLDTVKELQQKWNETGHVPFKEKDKLYDAYREICDRLYERARSSRMAAHAADRIQRIQNAAGGDIQRLQRAYEQLKAEIKTYENNLGFLSTSSKKGNALVDMLEKKVQALKAELKTLEEKMKAD